MRFLQKIKDFDEEFKEKRNEIKAKLRDANERAEEKRAELRRVEFKQTKAKAGYL